MGWVEDVGKWISNQFEIITNHIRDFVIALIADITEGIRILMMGARRWLAEFMSTTAGFWISIGAIIVLTIGIQVVVSSVWFAAVADWVRKFAEDVRMGVGVVLHWMGFEYANVVHELALIFVKDYAEWWEPIYQAFGTMSQELGIGIGTINTLARAGQQLAALGFMVAGVPAAAAWITSESDRATFLERVEERWLKYASNPYAVFTDIDLELVFPAVEMLGDTLQYRWGVIQENTARLTQVFTLVQAAHDTIDQMLDDLPEEFAVVRDGVWNDISTEFQKVMTEKVYPWLEKIDRAFSTVNDFMARQEYKVQQMIEEVRKPGSYLLGILILPEPFRSEQLRILGYVFERAYIPEVEASRPIVFARVELDRAAALRELVVTSPDPTVRPTERIKPPIPSRPAAIPGWYVGDY